jgi:beta-glucanase (GH16 family)
MTLLNHNIILLILLLAQVILSYTIDKSTHLNDLITKRHKDGKNNLKLVMSDEFNVPNRDFSIGKDDIFESITKPDNSNQALQFYNSSKEFVTTKNGKLIISTKATKTTWNQWDKENNKSITLTKNYTSGMIQTWNKFCFTGGVLDMKIKLPGQYDEGGLW